MVSIIRKQIANLPNSPGVYLFRDKNKKILYIGKSGSIRKRVQSYFRNQLLLLPKTQQMILQIAKINFIKTNSEIEALILESNLIKKQKPKYNVAQKDDKNYLYVKVEKDNFPRILAVRKPEKDNAKYFGPFTDAFAVRKTLSFLRRIFLWRTCQKMPHHACLLYHIKRCSGPCVDAISKEDYQKIIKQFILFMNGRQTKLVSDLKKEMKETSAKKDFEKAAVLRDRIYALGHISKVAILKKELAEGLSKGLKELLLLLSKYYPELQLHSGFRIEAYDVSNTSGTAATGSMIVFVDGEKTSDEYRKFAIKTVFKMDDVASMKEILRRRFAHKDEWLLPDLIIVDGGKGQLKAVREALSEFQLNIPYIALAKKRSLPRARSMAMSRGEEIHLPQRIKPIKLPQDSPALLLLQRIRDEAHRFAKSYHIKLRGKRMMK